MRSLPVTISFLMLLSVGVFAGEDAGDTEVNVLDGNTYQDGQVNKSEAKRHVADEIHKEGEPPYSTIRMRKSFTPPSGWAFRPFRQDEKDLQRIREALRKRKEPTDGISWQFWKTTRNFSIS